MHITGKEKTLAAKPVQEVLAVGWAVSEGDFISIFPLTVSQRSTGPFPRLSQLGLLHFLTYSGKYTVTTTAKSRNSGKIITESLEYLSSALMPAIA
jgi:hypothetical protein